MTIRELHGTSRVSLTQVTCECKPNDPLFQETDSRRVTVDIARTVAQTHDALYSGAHAIIIAVVDRLRPN